MNFTKTVDDFLVAWLDWVEGGAQVRNDFHFNCNGALCCNLFRYDDVITPNQSIKIVAYTRALQEELASRFARDGLETLFPFGDLSDYHIDGMMGTHHRNTERVEWVKREVERIKRESI